MDLVSTDMPVTTITSEAGPRLKHRERDEYKSAIYNAPKKCFINLDRTQIPPVMV
jgi:hypothetical protein